MNDGAKQIYERILETDVSELNTSKREELVKYSLMAFVANRINKKFFDWLKESGYYSCPAAKHHHGNCYGGLFIHSFEVTKQLILLTELHHLEWQNDGSPVVIGLLHDVCKLMDYNYDFNRQKQTMYGMGPIEYCQKFESGHGSKSVLMLSSKMMLTEEESLCIRYHMGAYTDSSEWKFYDEAIQKCPNVFWTHTADMIASKLENK